MKRRVLLAGAVGGTLSSTWLTGCGGGSDDMAVAATPAPSPAPAPAGSSAAAVVVTIGADDAATAIQAALDQVKAAGRRSAPLQIQSSGAFTLSKGIVLDPYYHDVDFMGATVTYAPTSGAAITVQGETQDVPTQLVGGVSNLNLLGPTTGDAKGLLYLGTRRATRTSSANRKITTKGFDTAIEFGDFGYLTHFHDLVIDGFITYGLRQLPGTDSGENISVHGGVISNGLGTAIVAEDDTVEIFLYGVSIDYNVRVLDIRTAGGNVEMHGGHIEVEGGVAVADQIKITGNGSSFKMFGGYWVVNVLRGEGPYAYPYIVNVATENSSIVLDAVRLVNHRNTADVWAVGPGRVVTTNCILFNVSLMPYVVHAPSSQMQDGGFERDGIADFWYVAQDQANGYSGRTNGGAMTLARDTTRARTGSACLRMQRGVVGNGFVQIGGVAIAVESLRNRAIAAHCYGLSDLAVLPNISFYWAALRGQDSNGRPVWATKTLYSTNFYKDPLAADSWRPIAISNGAVVPPWATHLVLEFDLSASQPGGSLWIDDFTFHAW
jgi:hypothetical protein